MFLLRCSTHCLPSLQWIINLYSVYLVVFGWRALTYILGSLVLPPRLVKFSREEALSYSFWYLSSYKNIAFNKAYICKMFIEWIRESHRFYLVQWLEILKRFWRRYLESYFTDMTQAPSSTVLWLMGRLYLPPIMGILVYSSWLIFRKGKKMYVRSE